MENEKKFYSVSDLAAELGVPRTTVNDWLKKFDRYIDFEMRGRRKVYTDSSLEVLKMISQLRDQGKNAVELEEELAAKCAVRPEVSPLADENVMEETMPEEKTTHPEAAAENLPAIQRDMLSFLQEFEKKERGQEKRQKRSFLWISVLLILLLISACATLLLLGHLLTLRESAKTLEMRLSASREEAQLLRESTTREFKSLTAQMASARRSGNESAEKLQKQLTDQRRQFEKLFQRLEKAGELREEEIRRLKGENRRLEEQLTAVQKQISAKEKAVKDLQKSLFAAEKKASAQEKQLSALKKEKTALEKKIRKTSEKKAVSPKKSVQKEEKKI